MIRRQNSFCLNWLFLLVGLFFINMHCDARAVNVSNTWTMPQEGLNVFYRFFRDRISWFEADAVCQFHHANLVTVDNSFQFDATRDLLRELDVNDIVWIGLMRPQSSDRFMWSNSRPLVADTGYWAESLPLMDAPLCAVIDPIRDYRWHALRCGGPETASFLCEMPVPSWADACNLKDMPNLTLQYMADTASIELIRNCQEEGLLRTMCRGKQDREQALRDLICPRERLEAQRINDITNSHFKSLQIINSIPSDNNENNDIELLPMDINYGPHSPEELQTEKNTVQRLIEQFNVDELMQADEPSNMETVSSFYKIPELIPKPVKKSAEKVLDNSKKIIAKASMDQNEKNTKSVNMEDMMMGDQPSQGEPEMPEHLLNEDVPNEILEPLPHIKKTNIHKEDIEKMEKVVIAIKKNMQKSKEIEAKKILMMSSAITTTTTTEPITTTTSSTTTTTTEKALTTSFLVTDNQMEEQNFKLHNQQTDTTTFSSPPSASVSHPIHPQQQHQQQQPQHTNLLNEEGQFQHNKETADNSHFIPPMLLVKSHYVPPANKHGHMHEHEHHIHSHHLDITTEQPAETTIKHERNQTDTDSNETTMGTSTTTTGAVATIAQVLDLEKTTLKSFDTSTLGNATEEEEATTTITENDKNIKPITEELPTEKKQEISENLFSKEIQTTIATTILDSVSSTDDGSPNGTSIPAETKSKFETATNTADINRNNVGTYAEVTEATKLFATKSDKSWKSTEELYEFKTTEKPKEEIKISEPTTIESAIQTEQHVITSKEDFPTTLKNEDYNGKQPTVIPETVEVITEAIATQIGAAALESLQQIENIHANDNNKALTTNKKSEEETEREKEQDKKETIVKTTEILEIPNTTSVIAAEAVDDISEHIKQHQEQIKEISTITTLTPSTTKITTVSRKTTETASISTTTTTTVKPITTTTTTPQNEVKSTETSASSTSITTTTVNNNNNNPTNTPTSIITTEASTSTTLISSSTTTAKTETKTGTETETETEIETKTESVTPVAIEISTQTSPPPPTSSETTRNFLKITTEIPFKPNRRRSLTKPETVSYMKKILG